MPGTLVCHSASVFNAAALVQFHPASAAPRPFGVRLAAYRDEHFLRFEHDFFIALGRYQSDAALRSLGRLDASAKVEFQPLSLQQFLQRLRDVLVK